MPSTTTTGSDVFIGSSPTTLFLTDEDTTADDAADLANWGDATTWQTIYYGYRGSGDYLDSGSYEGQWTINN